MPSLPCAGPSWRGKRALPAGVHAELELLDERRFRSGVVYLHYRFEPKGARDVGIAAGLQRPDHRGSQPRPTSRPPSRAYPSTCTRSSTPTASSSSTPACSTPRRSWTRRRAGADAGDIPRDVVWVINTHLHFDHCGGNRLFPGVPIHVQRLELQGPHDPHEWVDFPGATYVEHDGEAEVLPGIRLLPTPGHTRGHQSVLVDTPDGLVVIGGDVAYTFHELGSGATEGQRRVLALAAPTGSRTRTGDRKFLARSRATTRAGARPSRPPCGGRAGLAIAACAPGASLDRAALRNAGASGALASFRNTGASDDGRTAKGETPSAASRGWP